MQEMIYIVTVCEEGPTPDSPIDLRAFLSYEEAEAFQTACQKLYDDACVMQTYELFGEYYAPPEGWQHPLDPDCCYMNRFCRVLYELKEVPLGAKRE